MTDKFDLEQFTNDNNVTHITINDKDVVYIQIPEPEGKSDDELEQDRRQVHSFFEWLLSDFDIKVAVEYMPLNITVLTKKEEFVARLGDKIVEL